MTRPIFAVCIAMTAMLSMVSVSEAHKVNIFAYVDGNSIVTDSGYSRSRRVHDGVVEVYDAGTGELLLSGRTDQKGMFSFAIPERARQENMNLRLLLKAGEGHQAQWVVKAEEFGAAGASVASPVATESATPVVGTASSPSARRIAAIVRRELAPVKRMLAEMNQPGPSVTEIVGGIGYIFGLFGIAAYMKSRRKNE